MINTLSGTRVISLKLWNNILTNGVIRIHNSLERFETLCLMPMGAELGRGDTRANKFRREAVLSRSHMGDQRRAGHICACSQRFLWAVMWLYKTNDLSQHRTLGNLNGDRCSAVSLWLRFVKDPQIKCFDLTREY